MAKSRFIEPVKRVFGANPFRSPRNLHHAYLDRNTGAVKAVKTNTDGSALDPGEEPFFVWNGYLLTGQDGVLAGDTFNRLLYACNANGIMVFPPDYDGANLETDTPAVSRISHTLEPIPASDLQRALQSKGHINYVVIPFNARDEAGPWTYHGTTFEYSYIRKQGTFEGTQKEVILPVKQNATFEINVINNTSYVQIYRTTEHFVDRGDTDGMVFYYLGRFQNDGTHNIKVLDDRSWWAPGYFEALSVYVQYAAINLGMGDVPSPEHTLSELVGAGVLDAADVTLPSVTLDRTINMHTVGYAGASFDCTSHDYVYSTPQSPSARCMLNQAGIMLYGDVTWKTKMPQIMAYEEDDANTDLIYLQYEYELPTGKEYGPVLTVHKARRLQVAWQGEQALLVYRNRGGITDLLERLVVDSQGRYVTQFSGRKDLIQEKVCPPGYTKKLIINTEHIIDSYFACVNDDNPDDVVPLEKGDFVETEYVTFWTYDAVADGTPVEEATTTQVVSATINESNVILMSAQNRPWEVTTDQFFAPDRLRVAGLFPARLAEEEGLRAYDFCVGTAATEESKGHVFVMSLDVTTRTAVPVEIIPVGLKENGFERGVYDVVNQGVCFAGTDERLYFLSGRQYRKIDGDVIGLWGEIWDLAYHPNYEDLYIATDTGVWVFNFEFFGGIYKHISVSGATQSNLSYVRGIIGLVEYDCMVLFDETKGAFLLEQGTTVTDASLAMQPLLVDETEGRVVRLGATYDKAGYAPQTVSTWMRLRHSTRHSMIVDAEVTESDVEDTIVQSGLNEGKYYFDYPVPSALGRVGGDRRPRLVGPAHKLKAYGFETLYEIDVDMVPNVGEL